MRLRTRMATVGTALALLGAVGVLPGAAAANAAPSASNTAAVAHAKKPAQTTLPVAGTLGDGTAFTGALSNLKTKVVGKTLTLTGTITGTGLPAGGEVCYPDRAARRRGHRGTAGRSASGCVSDPGP